ncbi:cation transport protein-domain-containing protein [Corynascus similis CBS 632.67]
MWKPPINFIALHYAWIIFAGLLALVVVYPYSNVSAIDAWFFGVSASTESGLNTVDVKALKTYQQVYIYVIPIITNLGFINIIVVAVRLCWFEQRFKAAAASLKLSRTRDIEAQTAATVVEKPENYTTETEPVEGKAPASDKTEDPAKPVSRPCITFGKDVKEPRGDSTFYIPPPRERDDGHSIVEKHGIANGNKDDDDNDDAIKPAEPSGLTRRRGYRQDDGPSMSRSKSLEQAATALFVIGNTRTASPRQSIASLHWADLPYLSQQVTVGRNSNFHKLSAEDRERLGGIEYRALKLLLKILSGYFFGLHLFGVLCLLPWIHHAPAKYTDWLEEAFYSAQTMVNNLGFTLTPDSMVTFKDAAWPLLVMTFLAYAGETFYPVFVRLIVWIMSKLVPKNSSMSETLQFLLDHPRRCCMLLFCYALFAFSGYLAVTVNWALVTTDQTDSPSVVGTSEH